MTTPAAPDFVRTWVESLTPVTLGEIAPDPTSAAIFSADMINGFLYFGPLASPRVAALEAPVVSLFQRSWDHGIREFVLPHDAHTENTPEFGAYPPHCLAGSGESETIPALANLPFADAFTVIEKNSLNPAIGTVFDGWLDIHREITTAIVVGDCTDLCVYQLAMHLRMRANALDIADFTVVVPANAVDTFDIPASEEMPAGAAHPGSFFHEVFLYHMAQNGIRVVSSIA